MRGFMYLSQSDLSKLTPGQIDSIVFGGLNESVEKADFAVVCGTAPKYAQIRAEIAAVYYKYGGTENIIVSGGAVADKSVKESTVLRKMLLKSGVPQTAVTEEPNALDTIQNITCTLTEICKRTDIMQVESIAVITEPFHMKRALLLAKILLPPFIKVYGFTQGAVFQREQWKTDERLKNCVKNETVILKDLIIKGRINDIQF